MTATFSHTRVSAIAMLLICFAVGGCGRSAPASSLPLGSDTPAAASLPESARQMLAWLPGDNAVPGWTRQGQPRHFIPANLWEYIDGGAEAYLRFDFQEVVAVTYVNRAAGLEIAADLYRMATPVGAFGIYAQELNPDATFVAIGGEGSFDGTAFALWTGSCYLKLASGKDHPELAAGLKALAAEVARRAGGATTRPPQFGRFPTAGLVAHSFKVVPKDVLGQNYLAGGFEAKYGAGKGTWTLSLVPFGAADQAKAALGRYRGFLSANGKILRDMDAPGNGGFVGRDGYYGTVVAACAGASIAFAVGAPTEGAGIDAVAHVLK